MSVCFHTRVCVHLSERSRENQCIIDDGVLKLLLLSGWSGALKTTGCSAVNFRGRVALFHG